jgi:hypothetical protein
VQQSERLAREHLALGGLCGFARIVVTGCRDCVDGGIDGFDPFDAGIEQFDGRNLFCADHPAQFDGIAADEIVVSRHNSKSSRRSKVRKALCPCGRAAG